MKTKDLLRALNLAKPALGKTAPPEATDTGPPVLTHFCFDEDVVYAFDDVAAIIVGEKTGLRCGLHGNTLVALLEAGSEQDITITPGLESAVINFGKRRAQVPSLPPEVFTFTYPEGETFPLMLPVSPALLKALKLCGLSAAQDSLAPEFGGVTSCIDKAGVTFYSSDNATASRYKMRQTGRNPPLAVVVPYQTCAHLAKLAAASEALGSAIHLNERHMFGAFSAATVVSKLLPAQPELFEAVFSGHLDGLKLYSIPDGLAHEINKAHVLTAKDQTKLCRLDFSGGKLTVSANGMLGEIDVTLPANGEGAVDVPPEKVLRILPHVTSVGVNDGKSLVFAGDNFTHLISAIK